MAFICSSVARDHIFMWGLDKRETQVKISTIDTSAVIVCAGRNCFIFSFYANISVSDTMMYVFCFGVFPPPPPRRKTKEEEKEKS